MHDHTTMGKVRILTATYGSSKFSGHFPREDERTYVWSRIVRVYIDDLLLLTKDNFEDHLHKMDLVLQRLQEAGLKVNAEKSFFGRTETDYLGFHVCRKGIRPLNHKVSAILNIAPPTTIKKVRSFVGMVNF